MAHLWTNQIGGYLQPWSLQLGFGQCRSGPPTLTLRGVAHGGFLQTTTDAGREAARILRPDGFLILKYQDMVSTSGFRSHSEIVSKILREGFVTENCFVLTQVGAPALSHGEQVRSRRNHSYFYVLRRKGGKKVWRGVFIRPID